MKNEYVTLPRRQLRTLHLFAGAGGGILADLLLDHRPIGAVEIEEYPRRVLLQRQRDGILPKFPIWDDVQTFDGRPWRGKVDIVCGGFPCQDISSAGKGAGIEGARSSMWKHMARIIGEIRPQYAFVENSPMLVGRGLAVVIGDLAKMGYDAKWCVLGAHHVGAPHKRDRIWILATDSNVRGCDDGRDIERQHKADNAEIWETQKDQQSRSIGQYRIGADCGNMANTSSKRLQGQQREIAQGNGMRLANKSENVSNAASIRQQGQGQSWFGSDPAETGEGETDHAFSERVGHIWGIKSPLGRVAHGVADRVDRLKAIGNGQVPAVAALAWKTLTDGIL